MPVQLTDIQQILDDSGLSIRRQNSEVKIELFLKLRKEESAYLAISNFRSLTLHLIDAQKVHHGQEINIPLFLGECIVIQHTFNVPAHGKYSITCGFVGIDDYPEKYAEILLNGGMLRIPLKNTDDEGFDPQHTPLFEKSSYAFESGD